MFSTIRKALAAFVSTIRTERAPAWAAEPVRRIANRVAAYALTAGTFLVAANQLSTFVPVAYRDKVSAVVAGLSAGFAAIAKLAGEITRSKVFSSATVNAGLAPLGPTPTPVTTPFPPPNVPLVPMPAVPTDTVVTTP